MSEPSVCVLGLACCGVEAVAGLAPELAQSGGAGGSGDLGTVLVVAGTVTTKLAHRLRTTHANLPAPVQVIAYGACAISGGPYWDSYSVLPGADQVVPVALAVPGCPPRPADLAAALAALAGTAELDGSAELAGAGEMDHAEAQLQSGVIPEQGSRA